MQRCPSMDDSTTAWLLKPRYLTFNQAQELGGSVRKHEHGTRVYFVKQLKSVIDPSHKAVMMLSVWCRC